MSINENKLNRSRSESELYNASFDRSFQHIDNFYKQSPAVRRTVVVEEIYGNCDIRRFTSCIQLDHNTSNVSHLQNYFGNITLEVLKPKPLMKPNTSHNNYLESNLSDSLNEIVPMEVDSSFDWEERYPKRMGTDFESSFNRSKMSDTRYKALDNVLKQRLVTQKPHRIADGLDDIRTSEQINPAKNQTQLTKIIPIQNKESSNKCLIFLILLTVIIALYTLLNKDFGFISVNSDIQIENLQRDLLENVHEQSSVEVIVRSLEERKSWPEKIKVLGFIGSQGVGKTFVANIIKKHFVDKLVHDMIGVHLNYKSQQERVFESIKECCLNLIVIDDLTRKDDVELFAFVHSLPKNQFILVISIFNIHYFNNELESEVRYDDILDIRNSFDHSGLHHELVVFREFTQTQVEDWLRKQLIFQNTSSHIQDRLMQSILNGHDIKKKGLKGLQAKMFLELQRYNK